MLKHVISYFQLHNNDLQIIRYQQKMSGIPTKTLRQILCKKKPQVNKKKNQL